MVDGVVKKEIKCEADNNSKKRWSVTYDFLVFHS